MDQKVPGGSGLRHEAEPELQEQAAREQEIERVQDEIDAAAISEDADEPMEHLGLDDERRVLDLANRRIPRA